MVASLPSLQDLSLENKRVFVRADLNVPLADKTIVQDARLHAILPTIDYIHKHGGKVILATHIGRPDAPHKNFFDENLSTKILIDWFERQGYTICYEMDLERAIHESSENPDEILLLENLRFFNGERETSNDFAQLLAQMADVYVNDAFGVMHRTDTSITLLAQCFTAQNRAVGRCVEQEIATLSRLTDAPQNPFMLVIGGAKIKTKIKLLSSLLEHEAANRVHTILIGGAIANTFLHAHGHDVGASLIEEDMLTIAHNFLQRAPQYNVKVILPADARAQTRDGQIVHAFIDAIPDGAKIVDIGPKTEKLFAHEIEQAHTIFANGPMGKYEKTASAHGTDAVLHAIAHAKAYSVVGGGDLVAAAYQCDVHNDIDFISTGGGATLAFLSAREPEKELPGLAALLT